MNVTVYLPDELAKRAKDSPDVNVSRLLRDALEQHFQEVDAMTASLAEAKLVRLSLEDNDGRSYVGRFTGTMIADDDDVEVYLVEDGTVIAYESERLRYSVVENPSEDLQGLGTDAYLDAMNALGLEAEVDLVFN
jgi:hypothetical protein